MGVFLLTGKLYVNGEESDMMGNKIKLEFIKGYKDNPKINAFYLMKGTMDDVPKLPPMIQPESQDHSTTLDLDDLPLDELKLQKRPRNIPVIPESFEPEEESSIMLPVFVVIGAFIPILFFLCKL